MFKRHTRITKNRKEDRDARRIGNLRAWRAMRRKLALGLSPAQEGALTLTITREKSTELQLGLEKVHSESRYALNKMQVVHDDLKQSTYPVRRGIMRLIEGAMSCTRFVVQQCDEVLREHEDRFYNLLGEIGTTLEAANKAIDEARSLPAAPAAVVAEPPAAVESPPAQTCIECDEEDSRICPDCGQPVCIDCDSSHAC